ncbi:hypothetical protein L6R52_15045 [Myxococcota bacterium]|nr:hypothetical protein [Myxococcota bacterium]
MRALVTAWAALAIACGGGGPDAGPADAGAADAAPTDAAPLDAAPADAGPTDADPADAGAGDLGPHYLVTLDSAEALAGLGGRTGEAKYLAPVAGAPLRAPITERCYFQNMALYDYHLLFLRSFPELAGLTTSEYANLVLRRPTRIWWGGGVKYYPATPHPIEAQPGTVAWTVYHEVAGADRLGTDDVVAVHEILAGCVTFAPDRLAFLPTDPYQITFARQARADLAARGVAVVFAEELR